MKQAAAEDQLREELGNVKAEAVGPSSRWKFQGSPGRVVVGILVFSACCFGSA